MSKYFYFLYLSFKRQTIYRSGVLFSILKAVLFLLIQIMLWTSLYRTGTSKTMFYSLNEMITYQILSSIIGTFLTVMYPMFTVQEDVNSGNIVNYISKPYDYQIQLFMSSLGQNLFAFLFTSVPLLVMALFFTEISPPASLISMFLAITVSILSIGIYFEIYYMIGLVAFWFMDRYHTIGLLMVNAIRILSGAIIPLAMFPKGLRTLVTFLPIRYGFDFPLSIYFGKLDKNEILQGLVFQLIWMFALWIFSKAVFKTSLKKLIVQGG